MTNRVPRKVRLVVARFLTALGVSAIPIGILAPMSPTWWDGQWWPVLFIALTAAGWAALGLRQREPREIYPRENVEIRLVIGDLFEQDESVLIGMTSTFDTAVPDVIAPNSVQGNFLQRVYGGSKPRLDEHLTRALTGVASIGTISKPGKQVVYPIGTVATLSPVGHIHYFCAAYTSMDCQNRATGTLRGIFESLENTWDQVDTHNNGNPICVPLIGQGQSRIPELTPEIAIRLIAFSFLLRSKRSRFSRELRIVIHPSEHHKINRLDFQEFLTSLAAS